MSTKNTLQSSVTGLDLSKFIGSEVWAIGRAPAVGVVRLRISKSHYGDKYIAATTVVGEETSTHHIHLGSVMNYDEDGAILLVWQCSSEEPYVDLGNEKDSLNVLLTIATKRATEDSSANAYIPTWWVRVINSLRRVLRTVTN